MAYIPSDKILDAYADVLVNFGLGKGKGIKKGEVVYIVAEESAKPLFAAVYRAIIKKGAHAIMNYRPDDESAKGKHNLGRFFYENASKDQLTFFADKYFRGLADQIDHYLGIISDADPHSLKGVDSKKIMQRGVAVKPFRDWLNQKENEGKHTWVIGLYGTPAMANEAGLSEKEYWDQIIKACFLKESDPIKKWKDVSTAMNGYIKKMNAIAHKVDKYHVEGPDADLWITLGAERQWLGARGCNIPSFEIFTSPDWRGTEGWIRFNQPLYRYGSKVEGIHLEFKNGLVSRASAMVNEKLLKDMVATENANKIGEFSLTDKRFSKITKFMAETLYDENIGGPHGNTHIALGAAYDETFTGDMATLTKEKKNELGYNDSSVHTDIISTTKRTVTAHLKDGSQKIIYTNGEFVL